MSVISLRKDALMSAVNAARTTTTDSLIDSLVAVFGTISDAQRLAIKEALNDYHIERYPG